MKNNKKRGFTLVELLVVIAILAILATVAVVGYTSFITRAQKSNDESIANQMNDYLVALRADSNGEFYGEKITVDNINDVVAEMIEKGKFTLENQAPNHNYYYDLKEEKFVVLSLEEAMGHSIIPEGWIRAFTTFIGAEEPESYPVRPGNSFTKGNRYFLITDGEHGGIVAEIVNSFYSLGLLEGASWSDKFFALSEKVDGVRDNTHLSGLVNLFDSTIFVTPEGNFVADVTTHHTIMLVQGTVSSIPNSKTDENETVYVGTDCEYMLYADGKPMTIYIPKGTRLPANSLTVSGVTPGNVVIKINADTWSEVIDDLDAGFTSPGVIVEVGDGRYIVDGNDIYDYDEGNDVDGKGDKEENVALKYHNPMDSFNVELNIEGNKKVYNSATNVGYVALDKLTFSLDIVDSSVVGIHTGENISNRDVIWSVDPRSASDLQVDENGVFTIKNHSVDTVYVVATATVDRNGYIYTLEDKYDPADCASQTFEVKVVRLTGATLNLAGKQWAEKATLIHDADKETYQAVIEGTPSYNSVTTIVDGEEVTVPHKIDEIVLDESITIEFIDGSGNPVNFLSANGKNITTESAGVCKIKVSIGSEDVTYATYETIVTIVDASAFPVQPKSNKNIIYLGNKNDIMFDDLFTGTAPEGAEIRICDGFYSDDDYMNFNRDYLADLESLEDETFYVNASKVPVTETIKFNGVSGSQAITLAVYLNDVRISKDITIVNVVNGTNIREYVATNTIQGDELTSLVGSSNVLTDSVVMLNDITMSGSVNYFGIGAEQVFYGNFFTLDIKAGRRTEEGIINLKGMLRDARIIGSVYGQFAGTVADDCGSSAVNATGNAHIYNCYIANTRSPLRTSGNTILEDSTLFGGRYSNIDVTGGTLTIRGNVTTVQQQYSADGQSNVIGIGVSAWFNDGQKSVIIENPNTFKQYNFLSSDLANSLPALSYSGVELIQMKDLFNALFTDTYADYHFTHDNVKYVNPGIVTLDMYSLNYTATETKLNDGCFSGNYLVTVKIGRTAIADDEVFEIVGPSDKYYQYPDTYQKALDEQDDEKVPFTGTLTVTGAQLKAGVDFVTKSSELSFTAGSLTYEFLVKNDNYKSLLVTGVNNYDNTVYDYNMGTAFGLASSVLDRFHGSGIHYNHMLVDVHTPDRDNSDYQKMLREYLSAVSSNFYTPENYSFNAQGKLANFTLGE